MSNKRIEKKRAKAAAYRKRIKMVAELVVFLFPNEAKYEKRRASLALWKWNDWDLYRLYSHELLLRSPFRSMIPRRKNDVPVVEWRPITAISPHGAAIDRLREEVRR